MEHQAPQPPAPGKFTTAQQLIDALRSEDAATRQAAFDQVFPDDSALLICAKPLTTQSTTTTKVVPQYLFTATLFVQQILGKMCNLELQWAPSGAPPSAGKLVVPPPGSFR